MSRALITLGCFFHYLRLSYVAFLCVVQEWTLRDVQARDLCLSNLLLLVFFSWISLECFHFNCQYSLPDIFHFLFRRREGPPGPVLTIGNTVGDTLGKNHSSRGAAGIRRLLRRASWSAGLSCVLLLQGAPAASTLLNDSLVWGKLKRCYLEIQVLLGKASGISFISSFFRTGVGRIGHCFEGKSLLL